MTIPLSGMPLRIHLRGHDEIRSLVTPCRPDTSTGIRMRLTRGGDVKADTRISTTCKRDKTLLNALKLDSLGDWSFEPGDFVGIRYIDIRGWLYAGARPQAKS